MLKDLAVFLLSSLFAGLLFTTLISYTLGDSIKKDGLKDFASSVLDPTLMEQQCEDQCLNFENITEEGLKMCTEQCVIDVEKRKVEMFESIDSLYEEEILWLSMSQWLMIMDYTIILFILTVLLGVLILITTKEPLSDLGKNMISVAVLTYFVASVFPNLITMFSNVSAEEMVYNFLGNGLEQLSFISSIIIVAGVILVIIGYIIKWRKGKKKQRKTKVKKSKK